MRRPGEAQVIDPASGSYDRYDRYDRARVRVADRTLLRSGGVSQRPGTEGTREQGAPVAGGGLDEDRFEVVLDGVFGDEHVRCCAPGGGSGDEMAQ